MRERVPEDPAHSTRVPTSRVLQTASTPYSEPPNVVVRARAGGNGRSRTSIHVHVIGELDLTNARDLEERLEALSRRRRHDALARRQSRRLHRQRSSSCSLSRDTPAGEGSLRPRHRADGANRAHAEHRRAPSRCGRRGDRGRSADDPPPAGNGFSSTRYGVRSDAGSSESVSARQRSERGHQSQHPAPRRRRRSRMGRVGRRLGHRHQCRRRHPHDRRRRSASSSRSSSGRAGAGSAAATPRPAVGTRRPSSRRQVAQRCGHHRLDRPRSPRRPDREGDHARRGARSGSSSRCCSAIGGALLGGFLAAVLGLGDPIDEFFDLSTWVAAIVGCADHPVRLERGQRPASGVDGSEARGRRLLGPELLSSQTCTGYTSKQSSVRPSCERQASSTRSPPRSSPPLVDERRRRRRAWSLTSAAVSFLDSTALGVLVRAVRELGERGGRRADRAPARAPARRIFEITTLDRVLPVAASREDAVAELNAPE